MKKAIALTAALLLCILICSACGKSAKKSAGPQNRNPRARARSSRYLFFICTAIYLSIYYIYTFAVFAKSIFGFSKMEVQVFTKCIFRFSKHAIYDFSNMHFQVLRGC